MIPLYGFLQGDTIGLLILAEPQDTMRVLAQKLRNSASVRISPRLGGHVVFNGKVLEAHLTVKQAGIEALDRFDVTTTEAP